MNLSRLMFQSRQSDTDLNKYEKETFIAFERIFSMIWRDIPSFSEFSSPFTSRSEAVSDDILYSLSLVAKAQAQATKHIWLPLLRKFADKTALTIDECMAWTYSVFYTLNDQIEDVKDRLVAMLSFMVNACSFFHCRGLDFFHLSHVVCFVFFNAEMRDSFRAAGSWLAVQNCLRNESYVWIRSFARRHPRFLDANGYFEKISEFVPYRLNLEYFENLGSARTELFRRSQQLMQKSKTALLFNGPGKNDKEESSPYHGACQTKFYKLF